MARSGETGNESLRVALSTRPEGGHWVTMDSVERFVSRVTQGDATFELMVTATGHGSASTEFRYGQDREVTVNFSETASLEVSIEGYDGSGYEGELNADLVREGASNRDPRGQRGRGFDDSGRKTLGPVQPGDYTLRIRLQAASFWSSKVIAAIPVTLVPGMNRESVRLPRLYSLVVDVAMDPQPESLYLSYREKNTWWADSAEVKPNGQARFDNIPAGEYTLQAEDRGDDSRMSVRVPTEGIVTYRPASLNALVVRIRDRDGSYGDLGLRDGDLVIGVDGVELDNSYAIQAKLVEAKARDTITLLLQRGGSRVELTVDPRKLADERFRGGSMVPTRR